jgi:hypothetical protein
MVNDRTPEQAFEQLTNAQRMTLASVRVDGALTMWRVGAHKRTITALREQGLMRWPSDGGGLTQLGEAVKAIALTRGYSEAASEPRLGGRVSASINSFKASSPGKRGERG